MGGVAAAQYLECNTETTTPDYLVVSGKAPGYQATINYAEIRCFIHVLRESDGSGGLGADAIADMFAMAYDDFYGLDVMLQLVGQDEIFDSGYYANPDSFATSIFSENPHTDAIDIYLGPNTGAAKGRASGIPGSALVLTGFLDSYSALSHILGNCVGLYETDEIAFGEENVDGSNGEAAGDLILDTAADPGLVNMVSDCALSPNFIALYPDHETDPLNIMSNAPMSCWEHFSEDQRDRVLTALESYDILADVTVAEVEFAPYADYSAATELYKLWSVVEERSNAAAFNFIGDDKKDIIISGHTINDDTLNVSVAAKSDVINNNGVPVFADASESVFSAPPPRGTTGIILADYDNDGDLDFYAPNPDWTVNYDTYPHRIYRNDGGFFTDVSSIVFDSENQEIFTLSGSWGDYDGDGFLDLIVTESPGLTGTNGLGFADSLILYHNEPVPGGDPNDRKLVETSSAGIPRTDDEVLSTLWIDLDQDHDMDLVTIVCSQYATEKSKYYRNDGGYFTDISETHFLNRDDLDHGNTCGAPGDFDNDGDIDIIYHGSLFRGFFRNDLNTGIHESVLSRGWNEHQSGIGGQWYKKPTDLDVFDFDLDGWIDFGFPNSLSFYPPRVYRNKPTEIGFEELKILTGGCRGRGLCAADWNMDGFTELFIATFQGQNFFFRNKYAALGINTNHWVGIKLRADPLACNTFGIGATVIINASTHIQAQIVDGGSGNAGQHDLDLSFGLGAYSGSVNVKIIWPCGQTQLVTVQPDMYTTIELGLPEIVENSVKGYLEWVPDSSFVSWVFEWETSSPSDIALDQVEFPNGIVMGSETINFLEEASPYVDYSINMTVDGNYKHLFKWTHRPCDQAMLVLFTVHSRSQNEEFTEDSKLRVVNCPQGL